MSAIIAGASIPDPDRIIRKITKAFETWAKDDINDAWWDDQFRDMGKWNYGRETKRKNKEIVDSPRDIYDLGKLYESGRDTFNVTIGSATVEANWNWNATGQSGYHYAYDVHEGEGTSGGFPRPWTDELYYPQKFEGSVPQLALKRRIRAAFFR